MAIRSYEIKNPYGEIKTIGNEIIDYFEKPIYRSYINTGGSYTKIKIYFGIPFPVEYKY